MTSPLRPIYYDTETTGVRSDKDRIIELAAYDPVEDREFCEFIKPGIPIPAEASAIHHITDEMVKDASNFAGVAGQLLDFCPENAVLIAHNNDAFDQPFIEQEFLRASLDMPPIQFLDSLKWARRYRPDLPRHSLQFLREAYGLPSNQAHRALDDVITLYRVFSLMIDDLSLEQVMELLEQNKGNLRMPFGKHQGKQLSEVPKDYVKWLASSGALEKPGNKELKEEFEKLGVF